MRQIVQLNKLIVQDNNPNQRATVGLSGRADAVAWDGTDQTIGWTLSDGLGYLLVTAGSLAATCATGKQTNLRQGDLLIMNEAASPRFTMALKAGGGARDIGGHTAGDAANAVTTPPTDGLNGELAGVLYGSMRPNEAPWRALPFAQAPTWAMAVLQPTAAECARLNTLALLLHTENSGAAQATRMVASLQATLFEALSATLCAYDPLSVPQLAAGVDAQLSRALTAMAIAPGRPWRVETMANEAAMSRTAFAVRFKAVLGKTPLDYLTALRIQHAVTQFANHPSLSIDSVAKDVGYADESALRRAYLRVTGEALKKR
jgi:AraC-like DNA-binding protein